MGVLSELGSEINKDCSHLSCLSEPTRFNKIGLNIFNKIFLKITFMLISIPISYQHFPIFFLASNFHTSAWRRKPPTTSRFG